ncbi:MAG: hypothetical protein NTW21_39905 [Verrucomicrobia bacterium]|nr:hypothetical protein [Verrucomicrobiota bacterium]
MNLTSDESGSDVQDCKLWIIDCVGGNRAVVDDGPFIIGSCATSGLVVGDGPDDAVLVRVIRVGGLYHILPGETDSSLIFDGQEVEKVVMLAPSEHTLVIQGYPFVLRLAGEEGRDWCQGIDPSQWYFCRTLGTEWTGPVARAEIPRMVSLEPGEFIVLCSGMTEMGFYPHQISSRLGFNGEPHALAGKSASRFSAVAEATEVNSEYGEFTCPVCWLRFDRGDIMNIAVHPSLLGDTLLGAEHMQRFLATRFNDRGHALDAMGSAAPEIACPHCRRKLPLNFLNQPHHIFSIVGAPSSGKSYYLSVLIEMMHGACKPFSATFRDDEASENAVLNAMRKQLFSAVTPEEAYLAKTALEGALYETLPRQGRQVRLPKPFVFCLTDQGHREKGVSIVFYDNAGEHFEPGRNSADSPGTQHIAVASGIFFLFDPLYNPEFRRRLAGHSDPQLEQRSNDQQEILLAEAESRIKGMLGLTANERIATPLAVIAGKCDAWIQLLGDEPLLPISVDTADGRRVILDNLESNSTRVRNLLLEICPSIVANAEVISSNVRYFAASPLGHSPVRFNDSDGHLRIGPDPGKLNPRRVEDATLWVLAQIAPAMFPSNS